MKFKSETWDSLDIHYDYKNLELSQRFNDYKKSHLYFIGDDSIVKIGVSSNPFSRFKSINYQVPNKIKILKTLELDHKDTRKLERIFHTHFGQNRIKGEWFKFDENLNTFMSCL